MSKVWACGLVAAVALCACRSAQRGGAEAGAAGAVEPRAVAEIQPKSGSTLHGRATFIARGGQVELVLVVEGAPPGIHAAHLHDKGDCSAADGSSAGGHWNPTSENHGQWGHPPHHLGDIGNLEVGADGRGRITLTTDRWEIGTGGAHDIRGKTVIVHAAADDFQTQPTGNAGGRIGCGVIQ